MHGIFSRLYLILILLALTAAPAVADGTIDINIDPAAGKTIGTPGSYRLVKDVTMTVDVTAIVVAVNDVTLDLNGHTITAVGSATANNDGIYSTGARTIVYGGRVSGFPTWGVELASGQGSVRDVIVEGCNKSGGGGGINVGGASVVENCAVQSIVAGGGTPGQSIGIRLNGNNCRAINNTVSDVTGTATAATGIRSLHGSIISGNTIRTVTGLTGAETKGIDAAGSGSIVAGNTVTNCTSSAKGVVGIFIYDNDCVIESNVVTGNSSSATSQDTCVGIYTGGNGCAIRSNICSSNSHTGNGNTFGIYAESACTIESNTVRANTPGITAATSIVGIRIGRGSRVASNTVVDNHVVPGNEGEARGISVSGEDTTVRENLIENNDSAGTGLSVGIYVGADACHVIGNSCLGHSNISTNSDGYGIYVTSKRSFISENMTANNIVGIILNDSANYCELNRSRDSAVQNPGGSSLGAGDLANITY